MPRGIKHPDELRAQVVAAVLAGATVAQAARQFALSKSLVSEWAMSDPAVRTLRTTRERTPEALEAMLFDLVAEHITTLRAQLQAAAAAAYVQGQTAGDLAQLLGAERDTLIRLLAGFRPVDTVQPALESATAADAPPVPADDL